MKMARQDEKFLPLSLMILDELFLERVALKIYPPHPKLMNHGLRCKECPVGNPMEATQAALWKNLNISDAGRLDEFWPKRVSLIQGTSQAALPRTIFQILTRGFLQIPHIAPQ